MTSRDVLRKKLYRALRERFRGALHFDPVGRNLYATDGSIFSIEPLGAAVCRDARDAAYAVRVCRELGIGVHPRGGATGLAGESLGPGLVLDCQPGFRKIPEIDPDGRTARLQPGVTLLELNRAAAAYGLKFGPDPSSGTRAAFGGMVGTNATGAHSLDYGYTGDHLLEAEIITAEGERARIRKGRPDDLPPSWRAGVRIRKKYAAAIRAEMPPRHRNRSGYNLRDFQVGDRVDPLKLLAGSEGTLGLLTELTVKLVPAPKHTGIALFRFGSLTDAARAVPELLLHGPYSLELIDAHIVAMGRRHDRRIRRLLPEDARVVLLGEWKGETMEEVAEKMDAAVHAMKTAGSGLKGADRALDADSKAALWLIRLEAEALVMNEPGPKRAVSFVEDTAVGADRLADYLEEKTRILARHGFDWATFGHAGAGEMHTKVFIDPFDRNEYVRLERMAEELYRAAIGFGGTLSGEHGDGLLRSAFIPLQYPKLSKAFDELKAAIDPDNILNPGRKAGPLLGRPGELPTRLGGKRSRRSAASEEEKTWSDLASACHGCAACRADGETLRMCPAFRKEAREWASPRARGNLARLLAFGDVPLTEADGPTARRIVDSCLHCRMCVVECPTHVDIPRLMRTLKSESVRESGLDRGHRLAAEPAGSDWLSRTAPELANRALASRPLRAAAEAAFGLDRDAPLPRFESGDFYRKFKALRQPENGPEIVLYDETAVRLYDHRLGLDFVRLANRAGYRVIPVLENVSALPALAFGDRERARRMAAKRVALLTPYAAAGLPIVCTEPSTALMIRDEWPRLLPGPESDRVAKAVREVSAFLVEILEDKRENFAWDAEAVAYHEPCHRKALEETSGVPELFAGLFGGRAAVRVEKGCCGMAGTAGLFAGDRRRSLEIGKKLLETLKSGDHAAILTECLACRLQIRSAVSDREVLHPVVWLARRLA